ncbi:type II toxin-antitoxin system VapC family toxin [Candidatus Saccharibacteria bacterium]|nr:type II toxin-antitoxin system VapC family toxin [Candidatus Saccharibacteria bacterium]
MAPSRLLLDSHVFLWLLQEPQKIGKLTMASIISGGEACLSIVSIWELATKYSQKHLDFSPDQLLKAADSSRLTLLPLEAKHVVALPKIITSHGDPFDKMLLAQGLVESLPLVTADNVLLKSKYQTFDASQ